MNLRPSTRGQASGHRRRLPKLLVTSVLALVLLALTACHGAKHTPTLDPAWTYQVAGDSVTWNALMPTSIENGGGGDRHGANIDGLVFYGWRARDAQPRLSQNVSTEGRSPAVFAFAFGQNYANQYGSAESAELFTMANSVYDQVPGATCVVVVLPYRAGPGDPEIQRVRNDLVTISDTRASQGKPTVRVDWRDYEQPGDLHSDNVHLNDTDADGNGAWDSAEHFSQMLEDGRQQCGVL
jgi:hypothetical protein